MQARDAVSAGAKQSQRFILLYTLVYDCLQTRTRADNADWRRHEPVLRGQPIEAVEVFPSMPSRKASRTVPGGNREAFKNTSRTDFVYEQLREAIRSKRMRSGDRVRESEVAGWLGVSRTPVREAMNRLVSEHLLVDSQARGTIVAELEQQQVRELYALREQLEGMAAALAAVHAAPDEIDSLRDYLAQTREHFHSPEAQHKLNQYLHAAIYDAARNRYLSQALHKLADSLDLLRGTTYQLANRPESAYEEHREIVEAIARRDSAGAEAAARAHMREACRIRMRQIFGPQV